MKFNIKLLPLAIVGFFSMSQAQAITKSEYDSQKTQIKASYHANKDKCSALSGNTKDICVEVAKSDEKKLLAELEYHYNPTSKNKLKWVKEFAEAEYSVDKERCDDLSGNAKDVCVKEAKAKRDKRKVDGKLEKEVSNVNIDVGHAQSEAISDSVAKERCDAYSGNAKDQCVAKAKSQYHQ
jgi:hypothetical protein